MTKNYTEEQEKFLEKNYDPEVSNEEQVEKLAEVLDKTEKSVRAKLVKMNLYVKQEPTKKPNKNGPTKKELISTFCRENDLMDIFDGLMPAHKKAIVTLITWGRDKREQKS